MTSKMSSTMTTTMATTAAQAELTALLVQQFDEHQRQQVVDVNNNIKDHYYAVVETRAREVVSQVEELTTRHGLENLGLKKNNNSSNDDSDDDDDEPVSLSLEETLASTLTRFLDCAMASTDTEDSSSSAAVDAILSLCAAVAARCSNNNNNVVAIAVLQRTVEFSTVLLERVRCAACRCIGWIVQSLLLQQQQQKKKHQVDSSLASLLDTASQALVPRFIDKSQAVRLAAITASGCFFSSTPSGSNNIEECGSKNDIADDPDLRTSLTWALQHDASVVNRMAALHNLPVTVQTMDVVLSRLRDVKRKMRLAALEILQTKVAAGGANNNFMTLLDASQCAGIVQAGMTDRDEVVQNETIKLICTAWMKTAKFNPITILKHLNVVEYEDACEKIIQALLDADDEMLAEHLSDPEIRAYWQGIESATTPIVVVADGGKPSSQEELLDVNMVFFARARCHYVKDTNKKAKNVTTTRQAEAILSKVLPDIPVLCEIFERHSAALIKAVVAGGQEEEESDDDMDDNNSNNRRSSSIVVDAEKNQDALTLTCLQLLQMACMSSSEMEEGSRLHLKHTMTSMLGSIIAPDDVVEGCMATLQAIHNGNGGEAAYCRCVSDIVHQLQRDYEVVVSSGDDDGLNDNRLLRILSILSIVLENVSSASPSIVADFATIIVPAVKCETNELVREAAVSCIGKLGLFTPEQTVLSDFKPLLLKMVSDEDETLEVRAQAMLALCDWSILFSDTLGSCPVAAADGDDVENDNSTPLVVAFPDLVFAMMAHEELGMVCVAAEVACKLLIMGKICDSSWLARLVTLFFDVRLNDDDEVMEGDGNDGNHPDADTAAIEVGSPVRLQQLLSLFFPAYSHKSEQNRHALVGALSMILDSLLALHSQKRKRGAKSPVSISKVLDYVVDTAHAADQTVQENLANKNIENGSQQQKGPTTSISQFSTPMLMAAIQMASFLSKEHSNCKVAFLRTVCKHLGSAVVVGLQVEREKDRDLSVLMDLMEELSMEIADATCLKSLAPLNDALDTIELDEEKAEEASREDDRGDDDTESIVDAMQTMAISPTTRLDKENQSKDSSPRGGSSTTSSSGGGKRGGSSSECQRRPRLSNSSEGGVPGSSYSQSEDSPRGASTSSSNGGKRGIGRIECQRRNRLSNSNEGGVLGSC